MAYPCEDQIWRAAGQLTEIVDRTFGARGCANLSESELHIDDMIDRKNT